MFELRYVVYALLALVLAKVGTSLRRARNLRKVMPPGPKGLPLLGNVFQLPQFQWLKFTEWSEQYGPIFSLNLAGQPVVVLNTVKATADLFDRRSSIYSDRPRFIMAGEILTGGMMLAFLTYGDRWRRLRRAAHEGMNQRFVKTYEPLQEREAASLVSSMLSTPDDWDEHLRRSAASSVIGAVYGHPQLVPGKEPDPLVTHINDLMHRIVRALLPGAFLVDIFPALLYVPEFAAKWKKEGNAHHKEDTAFLERFYNEVREKVKGGGSEPCFAAKTIEDEKTADLDNKEAAWLAGTLFGAGAETSAAALSVFMLAMVLYPDVMRRAQAEIDAVVGRSRLPNFSDRPHLPYVNAIVHEVLRWRPVGPLGLPRRATTDDFYEGYFIPKGTIMMANVWAMNRDSDFFPDFDEFRPERFLDASGKVEDVPIDTHQQGHSTYGFGRRICIGMHLANSTLFIDMACLLWATNIEPTLGSDGAPLLPSRTNCVDEGLVVRPETFKCSITPRDPSVKDVLGYGHS